MIVRMKRVFLASRADQREVLLDRLRELGAVHLEPAEAGAQAPEELRARLRRLQRALAVVAGVQPAGEPPDLEAEAAGDEVLALARRAEEGRTRLGTLAREADRLSLWGNLRRRQLDELAEAGVPLTFYSVPANGLGEVVAECVQPLRPLPGKRLLVAVVQRQGEARLPEGSQAVEFPRRDLPQVRQEARELDAALADGARRLGQLTGLRAAMEKAAADLSGQVDFAAALAGAMKAKDLFAVQGWAPAESADALAGELGRGGVTAAVAAREPRDDENPPTLLRPAWWARPAAGLLQALDTVPGYREVDVSWAFMLALPIFAAILIGDAGYGLLFLLLPLVFYRKLVRKIGPALTQLLIVFGAGSLLWGLTVSSFFGVSGAELARAVWPIGPFGRTVEALRARLGISSFAVNLNNKDALMRMCFIIGAVHLSVAQFLRARRAWPSLSCVGYVGWGILLWGMYGVVLKFVLKDPEEWSAMWGRPWPYLLITGGVLAVGFGKPARNPFKGVALGLASAIFPTISTFGDTVSYLRLMAIALAGGLLASQFNSLACQTGTWVLGVPILVVGHALNIALTMIALFAHAVRLNILEFSNNLGMEWSGYSYRPFAKQREK